MRQFKPLIEDVVVHAFILLRGVVSWDSRQLGLSSVGTLFIKKHVYTCMSIRMYVCMYVCMYVNLHMCVYVYKYVCIFACLFSCMCVYLHVYMYVGTNIGVSRCVRNAYVACVAAAVM